MRDTRCKNLSNLNMVEEESWTSTLETRDRIKAKDGCRTHQDLNLTWSKAHHKWTENEMRWRCRDVGGAWDPEVTVNNSNNVVAPLKHTTTQTHPKQHILKCHQHQWCHHTAVCQCLISPPVNACTTKGQSWHIWDTDPRSTYMQTR